MRITAGELHGRVLQSVRDKNVRPTSSKTREALFNILGSVENFKVLDLYAGTGSVGFEAISRGASSVCMVDVSGKLLRTIKETAEKWNVAEKVICRKNDAVCFAMQALQSLEKYDLIFADPPFTENYPDLRICLPLLTENGFAVFEMPSRNTPQWASEAAKVRNYGESNLAIFQTSEAHSQLSTPYPGCSHLSPAPSVSSVQC